MEHLQPKLIEILSRYQIPVAEAEEMLQDLLLTLHLKQDAIESPDQWLLLSLKNRCLAYWRSRRERLCREVDDGLLNVLSSPEVPDGEKDRVRHSLERALAQLSAPCRASLEVRYGLRDGHPPAAAADPAEAPEAPEAGDPAVESAPAVLNAPADADRRAGTSDSDDDEPDCPEVDDGIFPCLEALTRTLVREGFPEDPGDA